MKTHFLVTLLSLLMLSSCGDLFSRKVKKTETDQFATCELDTNSLAKVMTADIQSDLDCLRANLKLFIEIVKNDKPGYLSHERLVDYINSNMTGVDQVTMDALAGIFDINNLLFGDERGYISKSNVDNLVALFKRFNQLMIENNIYEYFTKNEKVSFYEHNKRKAIIYSTFQKLSQVFDQYVVPNDNKIKIADVLSKFKNLENQEIVDHISEMLFLKKAFLGGNEVDLSSTELIRFIGMMGNASKITYDFINLPDTRTSENQDEEVLRILKEDLLSVYNSLYYKDVADEPIVTYAQVKNVVEKFFPDHARYMDYKSSILKVKEIFLGSNSEVFSSQEISSLFYDILYTNVAKGVFFYNAYAYNQEALSSPSVIVNDFTNLKPLATNSQDEQFIDLFNRISKSGSNTQDIETKGYKYFHGTDYVPLFDYEYKRNARGMFEVAVYEYLVGKFLAYYGTEDFSAVGDYIITLEQLEFLMKDMGEFFVGEGYIIPGKEISSAETLTLMATLFHPSSNGDSRVEINEFVELVVSLTSSLTLGSDMQKELRGKCGQEGVEKIHPGCYRLGLMEFLEKETEKTDGQKRSDFLPGMTNYLKSLSPQQYDEYVRSAAKFSRTCTHYDDGTEVPMSSGDFIASWAGFLVVEQSILTFDTDKSGVLEAREVDIAYDIYKSAVKALIPEGFMQRFSYQIFQYMVKYKRVPDIPDIKGVRSFWKAVREGVHLVQFIIRPNRFRRASADRMTFAKVLQIIGENSPAALENPFDCELLRDEETTIVQEGFNNNYVSDFLASMFGIDAPKEGVQVILADSGQNQQIPSSMDQLPEEIRLLLQANSTDEAEAVQQQQMQAQRQQQQQQSRN